MAMVCPQCSRSYEQRLHCPNCGERLLYQPSQRRHRLRLAEPGSLQKAPWGTFAVGVLLAQGLYFVFHQLLAAGVLVAWHDESAGVWVTLGCLLLMQAFRGLSVLAAGVLSGAGQERAALVGAAVGVWNGILFILIQQWAGQHPTTVVVFGEPILEAVFGALGGLLGGAIWKPIAPVALPVQAVKPRPATLQRRHASFAGPVAWGRVLTGITLAVGGVVWSDVIREFVMEASSGRLKIDTSLQAHLVTWEISALAIVAGGALAGATTFNGLTQGLWVGLGSGVVLFGIRLAGSQVSLEFLVFTVVSLLGLALVGGWFGSELLPPVVGPPRPKRLISTTC